MLFFLGFGVFCPQKAFYTCSWILSMILWLCITMNGEIHAILSRLNFAKITQLPFRLQMFSNLTMMPSSMIVHQWKSQGFFIRNAWPYLLIYFKQSGAQSSAKRFQFLLQNDESHPQLSSIKHFNMSASLNPPCFPPTKGWKPAENVNYKTTGGKRNPLVPWPTTISEE